MNMKVKHKESVRFLTEAAIIAAIYALLTMFLSPISYGSVQFRVSEALTILPVFTPAAIPGLTIGCFLANITSPLGVIDWIVGPSATLLAAICTYLVRKVRFKSAPWLAPLPPVIFNALIVGAELTIVYESPTPETFFALFLPMALSVGLGELVVCYVLGLPISTALVKLNVENTLFHQYQTVK